MLVEFLGTLAVVGVFVGLGLWLDRRVSVLPRKEELIEAGRPRPLGADHEVGQAPHTALGCDRARMARVAGAQRCACKRMMTPQPEDEVRFGDRTLAVVRVACPTCGATRTLYFDLRS
ncbi:MAG: hypothetical protein H6708_10480 [Kofleriaceae bacterium]|nr:hypothetical protein [Kofleriaceae bacterium]